jgi:NAD(P)-dependent dehydrogenase (short-subunit alcohol dehydrogenase family)
VELQVTPEFQKSAGVDMWADVPDKTRKLVDVMVEKGHLTPIGLVPSVAAPVLVHAVKLKDPDDQLAVIGSLEQWANGAFEHADWQMSGYDPIMVMWPLEGSSWAGFWGDVVDVVLNMNELTAHYGEAKGALPGVTASYAETEGGPFTVTVNSPEATDTLVGRFDTVADAKEAGENWKKEVVGMHADPDRAEDMYSWEVFDVDYDRMANG